MVMRKTAKKVATPVRVTPAKKSPYKPKQEDDLRDALEDLGDAQQNIRDARRSIRRALNEL